MVRNWAGLYLVFLSRLLFLVPSISKANLLIASCYEHLSNALFSVRLFLTPTKLKYRTKKLSQNDFCRYVDEEARLSSYHIIVISTKEGGFTSRHVTKAPLYTPGGCCLTCRLQPAQQNQYLVKKIPVFLVEFRKKLSVRI